MYEVTKVAQKICAEAGVTWMLSGNKFDKIQKLIAQYAKKCEDDSLTMEENDKVLEWK